MEVLIRTFTPSDASSIAEIGKKSWAYTYSNIFSQEEITRRTSRNYTAQNIIRSVQDKNKSEIFVAELNGKVIGFAQPCLYNYWDPESFDPTKAMLSRIYLDPDYLGKGIGKILVEKSEDWFREKGFTNYFLFVHRKNNIGLRFYLKNGFQRTEIIEEDEIMLVKQI